MRKPQNGKPAAAVVRCAIYTRKSTEEGLEQEFNSLDAQRESAEAFIKSQVHEGWTCLPTQYDDGGYTGGNMERPALRRLMADIEAGHIDCVVVYKVDRLSRSLLDFARMMETFERHRVSFVSVTQQFNTATSMGRLILNVLLSFAQFEREIISERTRDKIAATRRKGKYAGGLPVLGYDVVDTKLVVNAREAAQVRAIFDLYGQHEALLPVVQEIDRRGWVNKRWKTHKAHERGGLAFTKTSLYRLLTNVVYVGKVSHKGQAYDGEHEALIDPATWQRVQTLLQRNGLTGGAAVRNKHGALLKGLLRCAPCGCAMVPSHTKKGSKLYRYYVCSGAQKRGWQTCPSKSIPAGEIEQFVVDQIRCIGEDSALVAETVDQARRQSDEAIEALERERRDLERELARHGKEIRKLVGEITATYAEGADSARLADLQERIATAQRRLAEVQHEVDRLSQSLVTEDEAAAALSAFQPVWGALTPREQARLLELLIERVEFDGASDSVKLVFHASGIHALSQQACKNDKEFAA
jgi:site-specific DNA recombinase